MRKIIFALGVIFALIAIAQGKKIAERISPPAPSVKQAIAFAEQQIGAAYCYGAPTGNNCPPGTFDCSGLVYAAYKLPSSQRTSEEQWASERHVRNPKRGDLVFFTGSPIDPPPGHVGIYLAPHKMIDAYAVGTQVRIESFGTAESAPGLQYPTGYSIP